MNSMIFTLKDPFNKYNFSSATFKELSKDYNHIGFGAGFGDLSRINIFIGENNSGKSRFLRNIFSCSNLYKVDGEKFNASFKKDNKSILGPYYHEPSSCLKKFLDLVEVYRNRSLQMSDFFEYIQGMSKPIGQKFYFPILRGNKKYKDVIAEKLKMFEGQKTSVIKNNDSINHFLSLLNLENDGLKSFDIYQEIIYQEYFKGKKDIKERILTGGNLYNDVKARLLGEQNARTRMADFQKFMLEEFFSEFDDFQLIPNEKEETLYIKIGERELPVYDWGDGVQQIITIMFYIYIHREDGCTFFIEEPEIYLHPGILRKFIEVINRFDKNQYFITTHSNIILDASADLNSNMSIFKFKKVKDKNQNDNKEFLIEQCNNGDDSLLNELGVRNSSVFLSNCSIWVEGITDRLYLKKYLELYCEKTGKSGFRENLDYTFIEYGGANIVHYNFDKADDSENNINAKYINSKMFVIADNDDAQVRSKKYKRHEELKAILNENFYKLQVNEIENLIGQKLLMKVLINQNPDNKDLIEKKFKKKLKYETKKLGKYIDELFKDESIKKYASSSGTIKNKLSFCYAVCDELKDYDELTDEAKRLTEKVYSFIELNNK